MSGYKSLTIPLNSSNVVNNGTNNVYTYNFSQTVTFKKAEVCLQNLSLYYSWQNINSSYNNNKFSYIFPTSSGTTTINITIPSGSYSISDLNALLQSYMVSNSQYLINASGQYVYYLEIVTNSSLYAVQINSYPVPTSLPSGYSAPAGWAGYPASATTPQFVIPSSNIANIFGIPAGTYPSPSQSTNYSVTSSFTPEVSPVESVLVTCSLINNPISIPNNVMYSFSSNGQSYGSVISVNPTFPNFQPVQGGDYNSISVTFLDQNYNTLSLLDTNLIILLLVKIYDE